MSGETDKMDSGEKDKDEISYGEVVDIVELDEEVVELEELRQSIELSSTEIQMAKNMETLSDKVAKLESVMTHRPWYAVRVKTIALELMSGLSPSQIANKYSKKWDVSYLTVKVHYLRDARVFLATEILNDEEDIRIDLYAKYQHLYRLNIVKKDYKEARLVLDSIMNLTKQVVPQLQIFGDIQTIRLVETHSGQPEIEGGGDE